MEIDGFELSVDIARTAFPMMNHENKDPHLLSMNYANKVSRISLAAVCIRTKSSTFQTFNLIQLRSSSDLCRRLFFDMSNGTGVFSSRYKIPCLRSSKSKPSSFVSIDAVAERLSRSASRTALIRFVCPSSKLSLISMIVERKNWKLGCRSVVQRKMMRGQANAGFRNS